MPFVHLDSLQHLQTVLNKNGSFEEGWREVVGYHEALKPASYWEAISDLEAHQETQVVAEWLEGVLTSDPVPAPVQAFWVGIFQYPDEETKEDIYAIHIVGADEYDADDMEDAEWASDPSYVPEERYWASGIFHQIHQLVQTAPENDADERSFLDYILPIAYYSLLLNDVFQHHLPVADLLGGKRTVFISCGYDNGDFVSLLPVGG